MIKNYDRVAAVEYAIRWALSSNPKFFHFEGIGGDCTNFISQCLLAGGGVMNWDKYYGWFYVNANNRSPSWTSVNYLQRFLLRESGVGPFALVKPINLLELGDIIQLKLSNDEYVHSLIITKKENGEIFVSAHSRDVLNMPLSAYSFSEALGLHIAGIRF